MRPIGRIRPLPRLLPRLLPCTAALLAAALIVGCEKKTPTSPVLKTGDTITVAFYNVENLFDLHDDGTEYPEFRPGALNWNKQTWEAKNGNIASVIAAMHPGIIGLCEVENRNALELLRRELARRGAAYPHAAIGDRPHRTVTCPALLSRFPLKRVRCFGVPGGFPNRNILEAQADLGGRPLTLFVNHWPAKTHPESQRLAMAVTLANRIAALPAGEPYLVLGDLNSDYDEWTKFRTEGLDDTKGRTGLNQILNTIRAGPGRSSSFVAKHDLCGAGGGHLLYDCWLDLPGRNRFSRCFHGLHETPDHILLPQALLCGADLSYCDRSFAAFTWGGRLLRKGEPFGWRMEGYGRRKRHTGEGYSDHLPIVIRLVRRPFSPARGGDQTEQTVPVSEGSVDPHGFERSTEGWVACCGDFGVARDLLHPASGRYCLLVAGEAPEKNCCAARTVIRLAALNRSRWMRISLDIRGMGKIELRVRQGRGRWLYYVGPTLRLSASSRYLSMRNDAWRHAVLSYTADVTSPPDLFIELRAGKGERVRVWLDNVRVEGGGG